MSQRDSNLIRWALQNPVLFTLSLLLYVESP